jgi:6-phosphogluconolactonase
MNKHHTFQNEQDFIDTVVQAIHSRILRKIESGRIFRLALSGGSTPGPIYSRLAEQEIPWDQVEVYLVDERYVPLDHPHSNYRMIHETLLSHVKPGKFVYFDTGLSIEECLRKYESQLKETQDGLFDLILLGIGNDGHTASLFPNSPALGETERWVAHTTTDQFDVRDRLTLTFPALENADERFFLVKGTEKRDLIMNQSREDADLPFGKLIRLHGTSLYLCP